MKKIVITQSNYIPWKGYFDAIALADEFVIYDDMQFTKRDWRNRNIIKTQTGNMWLTIPVEVKGKYFQKINETKISSLDWNKNHWNIIKQNYNKSIHFNEYKDFFEELYLNSKSLYLSEINYEFISAICQILNIKTNIRFSSEFLLKEERSERLLDICLQLNGTDYFSGPAAKAYINEEVFNKANVGIHYFDYSGYLVYNQMNQPFDHGVSILDLIFCEGKNAVEFLKFTRNE